MALRLTPATITEQQLEDMIYQDPSQLEEGLTVLARQHATDSGPLDILAVDSDDTLVIMELKVAAVDSHLDQGLR